MAKSITRGAKWPDGFPHGSRVSRRSGTKSVAFQQAKKRQALKVKEARKAERRAKAEANG